MLTFFVAYMAIWLGVLGYVVRLGVHQRRLARTLESLESQIQPTRQKVSKAA